MNLDKLKSKKGWLNENITALIALMFILFTFRIFYWVLFKQAASTESTTITIVNSVTNITMLIVGFYFGSSQVHNDKVKQNETNSNRLDKPSDPIN